MEKLIYAVWKKREESIGGFKEKMLRDVAGGLEGLGVRGLSMNLADERAAYAQRMRITKMPDPLSGTLSIWLDTALDRDPVHRLLEEACQRFAGYLVLESVPIVNTTQSAPLGERTPGITTVAFLEKPAAMTYESWLDQWQGHHGFHQPLAGEGHAGQDTGEAGLHHPIAASQDGHPFAPATGNVNHLERVPELPLGTRATMPHQVDLEVPRHRFIPGQAGGGDIRQRPVAWSRWPPG